MASKRSSSGVGSRRNLTSSLVLRYFFCCAYLADLHMSHLQPLRVYMDMPCSVMSLGSDPRPRLIVVLSVFVMLFCFSLLLPILNEQVHLGCLGLVLVVLASVLVL